MVSTLDNQGTSTRPYLLRALHDWCTDNGFTPYIAVHVDGSVQVPMEYVKNNEIVLNVGFEATSALQLGNDFIEFKARFGGVGREIRVPVDHVVAIYARENGQGMAFPVPTEASSASNNSTGGLTAVPSSEPGAAPRGGLRLATAESNAPDADDQASEKTAVDVPERARPGAGPKSVPSATGRKTPARLAKDDPAGKMDGGAQDALPDVPPNVPPDVPPDAPPDATPPSGRPSLKRVK